MTDEFSRALLNTSATLLGVMTIWAVVITPRVLRRLTMVGVSGAIVVSSTQAAHSDDLDGLPLPTRPATMAQASVHVVQPGESLWSIAAHSLGNTATPARTAAASTALYATNRAVIGKDPNLIRPGQHLQEPTS